MYYYRTSEIEDLYFAQRHRHIEAIIIKSHNDVQIGLLVCLNTHDLSLSGDKSD